MESSIIYLSILMHTYIIQKKNKIHEMDYNNKFIQSLFKFKEFYTHFKKNRRTIKYIPEYIPDILVENTQHHSNNNNIFFCAALKNNRQVCPSIVKKNSVYCHRHYKQSITSNMEKNLKS
jgi:hypothetical protein